MIRLFLLLVLFASCTRRPPPAGAAGPVEAVQAFSAAIERGDASAAWALLSERTQREADRHAAEARAVSGNAGPQSGRQMLFASAVPGGKIAVRQGPADAGDAIVVVTDAAGQQRSYRTLREQQGWRLDLDLR